MCKKEKFTALVIIGHRQGNPERLIITCLPEGPTATFRLSGLIPAEKVPFRTDPSKAPPELILSGFTTRLGRRLQRLFISLFPQQRDFESCRVITLHCQRDFIFLRQHRYSFDFPERKSVMLLGKEKVHMSEIGPRLTLRLLSLQLGTFDSRFGEYEW